MNVHDENVANDQPPDALHVHEDEEPVIVPPDARISMHKSKDPDLDRLIVQVKSGIRERREAEQEHLDNEADNDVDDEGSK